MNKYETFWRRFFAGLIDGIIFIPIGFLDSLIIGSENILVMTSGIVVIYSSLYIYSVYLHWTTGQTFGKKWMNIRVVDKSESRLLTLRQSLMRDSIYMILEAIGVIVLISRIIQLGQYPAEDISVENYLNWLTTLWFLLEIGTMMTNKKRRAIHDFLANSIVIKDEYWKK